jgi:beta-glucuronidase
VLAAAGALAVLGLLVLLPVASRSHSSALSLAAAALGSTEGPSAGATEAPSGASGSSPSSSGGALSGSPSATLAPARYGPSERTELDGTWLFRYDSGTGLREHLPQALATSGWTPVQVPNAWNAHDTSTASMDGTIAWYRKDFQLPAGDSESTWLVRFESVNNRMRAWLNGKPIGSHAGAGLPFELTLPAGALNRQGVNHLVVMVDDRRLASDPAKTALWWNYGGILRRVYLQRVERVGFGAVQVLPRLPCTTCAANIEYRVQLHNYSSAPQRVRLTSSYGQLPVDLGTAEIAAGATSTFTGSTTLARPQLWSPASPHLYEVTLDASTAPLPPPQPGQALGLPAQHLAHYYLRSGVRSIAVSPEGTLLLNGQRLNFRGVGVVEDSPQSGAALGEASDRRLIAEALEVGATAIRSQYPLDEYLEELADEHGIMLWSEIPFDKLTPRTLTSSAVQDLGVSELRQNILANSSHPSIIVWSIANELWPTPDRSQGEYIARAVAVGHALDPTRPVGLAVAAYPSVGCQARYYAPLDVVGLNDYFGWYPGPVGDLKRRSALPGYLDAMRSCYRGKALVVTEFGVEANRPGPVGERGTYAFQQDWVRYQLKVFASKPWLAGAIYWALAEFRVRPGWNGGNPKPSPPLHTKGLISYGGIRKPAFYDVEKSYRATTQVNAP